MTSQISSIYGTLLMMWSDDVWRSMAAVSMAAIFILFSFQGKGQIAQV